MDLNFSDRQRQRQTLAAEFAAREVAPRAAALDHAGAVPPELLAALFGSGLMTAGERDHESSPGDPFIAVEEMSRVSAAVGAVLGAHTLVWDALWRFGHERQRAALLHGLSTDTLGGCSVSGLVSLRVSREELRAERTPSGWRLSGVQPRVQNAPLAGLILLLCETTDGGDAGQCAAFLVPADTQGLSFHAPEPALGLRGAPACTVALEGCLVSDEARLGVQANGAAVAHQLARAARLVVASEALGLARAALARAVDHVRAQRHAPLSAGQGVQFALVDLIADVEAAELLVRHAVASSQISAHARPFEAAQAALHACETALRVCHGALRIVSTGQLETAYDLDRYMRDAHAIGHVTNALRAAVARDALEQG